MRTVILAGGLGTRLRPYTAVIPKPLMPIGDIPILEVVVRQLRAAGVDHLTIAVNHLATLIQTFFGDGSRLGLSIDYSLEQEPLGTAGPLSLVEGLEDDFLVMNGDILTDLDYSALIEHHREQAPAATIATYQKEVKMELGVLHTTNDGRVAEYEEKPSISFCISMGIYVFSPRVLRFLERGERLDLPDLIRTLIAAGEPVLHYPHDGLWLDIGNRDDFERSTKVFEEQRDRFLPEASTPLFARAPTSAEKV